MRSSGCDPVRWSPIARTSPKHLKSESVCGRVDGVGATGTACSLCSALRCVVELAALIGVYVLTHRVTRTSAVCARFRRELSSVRSFRVLNPRTGQDRTAGDSWLGFGHRLSPTPRLPRSVPASVAHRPTGLLQLGERAWRTPERHSCSGPCPESHTGTDVRETYVRSDTPSLAIEC